MFEFKTVQDAFPDDTLELVEGKIFLNGVRIQTRWPTDKEMADYRKYHGDNIEDLMMSLIADDIQFVKDARAMSFEEAVNASKERMATKFDKQ
jgi:hypothetical protein